MEGREKYSEDVKIAIEYNAKQWCGNAGVKYIADNLKWPVSEEEYNQIASGKLEGMLITLEVDGKIVRGFYTAYKIGSQPITAPAVKEVEKEVVTQTGTVELMATVSLNNSVAILKTVYIPSKKALDIIFKINKLLDKELNVTAQTPSGKLKRKRPSKGLGRSRSVSSVSNKTSKHENSKS